MYSNNHSNDPIKGTYGSENIVIGHAAAYSATGSSFHANVILGANAGFQTKGKENVLIGEYAGHDLESGEHNVVIGAQSCRFSDTFETNTESVLVGYRTQASANGVTNENVFGNRTTGLGSNTVTLGNASVTDIYMAQDSGATIHAAGITTSGNISGSAISTGSFGKAEVSKIDTKQLCYTPHKHYEYSGTKSVSDGATVELAYVGHSHNYSITLMCKNNNSNQGMWWGHMQTVYGASTVTETLQKVNGSLSNITVSYNNSGGSTNYLLQVRVDGVDATVYWHIQGLADAVPYAL